MAYEELKAQIREYIKPNDQEEITGAIMQAILLEMVNQLGSEGIYLPLTGGNVTGGIVVSSDLSSPSHEALRLNQSGISVEKIASVGLNEILNVTANSITYSSYYPSETPNTLTISLGYTGVTLSGGVTAASFINSSVDASIRYQYLLKADGNVISISDIGGTDMQTVWEALAASTNEQINVSHLSTALNGYIRPTLSNLSNGDILVYDSVGTWVNTSMSSFLSGYATEAWVTTQLASYATQSWVSTNYLNRVSTNSGDIYINDGGSAWVLANLNTLIVGYGYITASALNGYATEAWVGQQGYLTSSALNGYIHPTITNLANGDILVYDSVGTWVNTSLASFNFATQTWVGQQGYITSSALSGYATETWVNQQGFLTSSALNGYIHPTLTNLAEGNIIVYDGSNWVNTPWPLTGYATQSWVNTQLAGYMPLSGGTMTGGISWSGGNSLPERETIDYFVVIDAFASGGRMKWANVNSLKTSQLTNDAGFITSAGSCAYATSAGYAAPFFANSTWYNVGDDAAIGDHDVAGAFCIKGLNGTPNIRLYNSNNTFYATVITSADIGSQSVNYANSAGSASYANGIRISATSGDILINDGGSSWVTANLNSAISGFGYITSSGSCNYANSAGSANILGQGVTTQSGHALSNGDILVYDSTGTWLNVSLAGFNYTTQSWVTLQLGSYNPTSNFKTINGNSIIGTGDITISGGSGNYLPLTGGTITGNLAVNGTYNSVANIKKGSSNVAYLHITNATTDIDYVELHCSNLDNSRNDRPLVLQNGYGNVGIGVAQPSYKLQVDGTGYFSDTFTVEEIELGHSNEINSNSPDAPNIHINYRVTGNVTICNGGGNCGIGTRDISYKLHVAGQVGATGFVNTSDLRKKNITGNVSMNLYNVANAPLFKFTWNDEKEYSGQHIGSAAQYWQTILPELVSIGSDTEQTLAMQYDVIALASVITVAKTVVNHERRIESLERENEELKKEIQALRSA